jgi:hypothetical protein
MILSKILLNESSAQKINIKCEKCGKESVISLYQQQKNLKKYQIDLCRGCMQHMQALSGSRDKQYINAGIASSKKMKGKTYEELYSLEKSEKIKAAQSIGSAGENNWNFGGTWHGVNPAENQKGKTLEELYGSTKANIIKDKISKASSGENNPMFGKPSPQGSGNGWSGWYKGWFFRSLKELSYMIYIIERFSMNWKTAETKAYKIEYVDYKNSKRTYHPDFIIEDKYLVEIKPKSLWKSDNVKRKKEAAIKFCENKKIKYKLTESPKLIQKEDIKKLINEKTLIFTKIYQEKWETKQNL